MTMQRYLCAACLCAALAASGCGRGTQGEPAADELSEQGKIERGRGEYAHPHEHGRRAVSPALGAGEPPPASPALREVMS